MLVAFIPMLLIAAGLYYMNRADPDCGTTFTWATKAFGPCGRLDRRLGADLRRHPRDGEPGADRGQYTFLLFGADSPAASTFWVTVVGVIWIV